jgi:hypothetical protein
MVMLIVPPTGDSLQFFGNVGTEQAGKLITFLKFCSGMWLPLNGPDVYVEANGDYIAPGIDMWYDPPSIDGKEDTYRMFLDGIQVDEQEWLVGWTGGDPCPSDPNFDCWTHEWNYAGSGPVMFLHGPWSRTVEKYLHGPWNRSYLPGWELIRFNGRIEANKAIIIKKKEGGTWIEVGNATSDSDGLYTLPTAFYFGVDPNPGKIDAYRMFIDSNFATEVFATAWEFEGYYPGAQGNIAQYSFLWNWIPSNLLIRVNRIEEITSQKINRVKVYGEAEDGTPYSAVRETPEVTSGEEKPIEFVYSNKNLQTQAEVDAHADYLFNLYNETVWRFEAEFKLRTDLELLQKIKFVDFANIPEEEMRITKIQYIRKTADIHVKIGFVPDQPLSTMREEMTDPSMSDLIDDVVDEIDVPNIEIGTVTNVSGNQATVDLERGGTVTARILNP